MYVTRFLLPSYRRRTPIPRLLWIYFFHGPRDIRVKCEESHFTIVLHC